MAGFRVVLASLEEVDVPQATAYEVEIDGSLRLECDGRSCAAFGGGEWVAVKAIGQQLVPDWPPDGMASLLLELTELLAVRWGHYDHDMSDVAELSSAAFNDTDRLLDAVLRSVGAESDPNLRSEAAAVVERHVDRWSADRGDH